MRGTFDMEQGGGHGFRQIILATSCCPMCSAAREELSLSKST